MSRTAGSTLGAGCAGWPAAAPPEVDGTGSPPSAPCGGMRPETESSTSASVPPSFIKSSRSEPGGYGRSGHCLSNSRKPILSVN